MLRLAAVVVLAVLMLAGCGGTKTIIKTVTQTSTVEVEVPAAPNAAAPDASTDGSPALATKPRRHGEVIFEGEGLGAAGPKTFKAGIYTVRFEQWAPEDPTLDFRTDSSSIVIQMNRSPGKITADTVTVTNATKKTGKTVVTMPAGKWYADVSADHSFVVRFTPRT